MHKSVKSLKLHNWRFHYAWLNSNKNNENIAELEIENIDSATNNGYFANEKMTRHWYPLLVKNKDRKFTTAIHENNADEYLVFNLQDKDHADKEKLYAHNQGEVTLMIGIAKLAANLKPNNNIFLMKIAKGIKNATEKRLFDNDMSHARAATPNDVSDWIRSCRQRKIICV